jgi:hypothetical protein
VTTRLLHVVLVAWAGSLWTICGLVAPSLFAVAPSRELAGDIAGYLFRIESWLGLLFGGVVLLLLAKGAEPLRNKPNYALVTVTVAGPVSNEVVLRPFMEEARAAGDMNLFGLMHGAGALLFGFACVTALILVWRVASAFKASRD